MFGKWHLGQREKYLPHNRPVLRLFPFLCTHFTRARGLSGVVATMPLAWRGHTKSLTARARPSPDLAVWLEYRRGFQQYYGIPFSCDMGCSPWHGPNWQKCGNSAFQPSPLPLLNGTSGAAAVVLEAPAFLNTLTQRYADWGSAFIAQQSAAKTPWLLYASFNHVHVTDANYSKPLPPPGYSDWQFSSKEFCGSSGRGGTGDAVQELDAAVGTLMAAVKARPSPIPSPCTQSTRAGIEWRRCQRAACMAREHHRLVRAEP